MNTLSWLLYLADVVGNVSGVAWAIFWLLAVWAGLCGIAAVIYTDNMEKEKAEQSLKNMGKKIISLILPALILVITPSERTVYLIAASEMGEKVINTEAAKKVEHYLTELIENSGDSSED